MKKFNLLLVVSLFLTATAFSQNEWNSINNSTSAMYRNGFVGIGTSAVPAIPFVVNNPTAGTGTKISFGNNNLQGSYQTSSSVLELSSSTADTWLGLNSGSASSRTNLQIGVSAFNGIVGFYSTKGPTGTAYPMTFSTHGAGGIGERMRILNEGNIGIGTTNPLGKLQVENGIAKIAMGGFLSGSPLFMANYVGWNAARVGSSFTFDTDGSNNGGAVIATSLGGDMRFITFPSAAPLANAQTKSDAQVIANTRLIIRNDGKVGIGAPSSYPGTYMLYVTGGILAEKIKVAINGTNAWMDLVFSKDYKLTPLNEVENFIKENNHLPEIPSAEEAAANGIDLAEINAKLLQKIEELTLHLIAQDKRIAQLEKK